MDDEQKAAILASARSNIAAAHELEREHAAWLARHDPIEEDAAQMRRQYRDKPMLHRDEPSGLIHKVHINEPTPAPAPAPGPSPAELTKILGECFAVERRKLGETLRAEQATELSDLKNQIAELRGQVGTLLSLLSAKGGDVVALPRRA